MEILYMVTTGPSDATRSSIPLHLAVNGSLEVGHAVGVLLAGDATELLDPKARESMAGIGLPPARELFDKARQHEIPIYV
jgi:predicted peroxiredoxin